MSIDCHLKLEGVKGESTHAKHKDEIELSTFAWSVTNASNSAGGGMAVGKGRPQDIVLTKKYDSSSYLISKHCAAGHHFKEATISFARAGGKQEDYLVIKLKEVFITSYNVSATSGGDITDQVTMSYADIEYTYKAQKADGTLGGDMKFGWDVRATVTR